MSTFQRIAQQYDGVGPNEDKEDYEGGPGIASWRLESENYEKPINIILRPEDSVSGFKYYIDVGEENVQGTCNSSSLPELLKSVASEYDFEDAVELEVDEEKRQEIFEKHIETKADRWDEVFERIDDGDVGDYV